MLAILWNLQYMEKGQKGAEMVFKEF